MKRSVFLLIALTLVPTTILTPLAADDKKEKPKFELTDDEKTLLELTNKERANEKLPPLEVNPILFKMARDHSANMAKKGEMKHVLDGKNPADRAKDSGYVYAQLAENVASRENATLSEVMKSWMDSKIHKDNILNKDFTQIGLGIAKTEKGEYYYTQVFGLPKKKK